MLRQPVGSGHPLDSVSETHPPRSIVGRAGGDEAVLREAHEGGDRIVVLKGLQLLQRGGTLQEEHQQHLRFAV